MTHSTHLFTVIWRRTYRKGRKEMFYLMMHSTHFIYGYMVSDMVKEGRKEMFYLMSHSTHFIYSYMASDIS